MLFRVLLLLISLFSSFASANPEAIEQKILAAPKLVIDTANIDGDKMQVSVTDIKDSTPEQLELFLNNPAFDKTDVVVSTDLPVVAEVTEKAAQKNQTRRAFRLIPMGAINALSNSLSATKKSISASFNSYTTNALHTLHNDKIGITVTLITTSYDSLLWIHSSSFSVEQKTSMVAMNIIMAAMFGLDRKMSGKITIPIKEKIIARLDRISLFSKMSQGKILAGQYISNLAIGISIQVIRTGLLSIDHLHEAVSTGDFWLTAIKIGSLATATQFAWIELNNMAERQNKNIARLTLRRFSDMRVLILSQLASISMVLQPEVYGHVPTTSFIVHGTIGLIALLSGKKLIDWLERNQRVSSFYDKTQSFENFLRNLSFKKNNPAVVYSCRALFVN